MEKKTALIIGATGLIGRNLTEKLLADERYEKIKIFVRRPTGIENPKLDETIVNFDDLSGWKEKITGDDLFSTLGTTRKQAKSRENQYQVDYTYQYNVIKEAAENKVRNLLLVSSLGANSRSRVFYSRIKGELETAVKMLPFEKILILRPSLLLGKREKSRLSEKIFAILFDKIPLPKKIRPIQGAHVAARMIREANGDKTGAHIIYPYM